MTPLLVLRSGHARRVQVAVGVVPRKQIPGWSVHGPAGHRAGAVLQWAGAIVLRFQSVRHAVRCRLPAATFELGAAGWFGGASAMRDGGALLWRTSGRAAPSFRRRRLPAGVVQ